MNLFIQRKVSTYLTGSSEISLSKLYATYSSESDKLTFGFNYPVKGNDDRLISLINPLIETDIKDNFATLYKKGEWQSNIRLGFKYSYFFAKPTKIKFYGLESDRDQRSRMIRKRAEATQTIIDKIDKEQMAYQKGVSTLLQESRTALKAKYEAELKGLANKTDKDSEGRKAELDAMLKTVAKLDAQEPYPYDEKLKEYENELAKAEVNALYEKGGYNVSKTLWASAWGFYPLTERANYIAANSAQKFTKEKFRPWELNFQLNYLREGSMTLLVSPTFRVFQNNSALADLMTSVDYNTYLQFPQVIDTFNTAILESNKAFIGKYDEFVTSSFAMQFVFALSDRKKKDGGERFLTPGVSMRFEKNFGDFSAFNYRLGFPLRFKGKDKDKAVNIEPQIRWNNLNNYADKEDYKVQPTFGINVGLPFTPLFKG